MMVKKRRITTGELKNVRAFGGDCKMVFTELKRRPVTTGEIATGVINAEDPRLNKEKK